MAHYAVGSLIRDARERQKYSQEELCYGICTTSTLSRIENGVQAPGKKILEGLMQRLGIADPIYNSYLSREEMERYEIEEQLTRCLARKEYARAAKYVDILEERLKESSKREYGIKLEEQYLYFARALICKNQGESAERIQELLLAAIHMTIPEFDGIHIRARLLTFHEISILNNIGCAYHAMGKVWDALRLLFELMEYIEGNAAGDGELSVKYLMILQNLSSWMGQERQYKEALELCQKGIDYCVEYGKMHIFPMLLCNKACALAELGQYEMSKEIFYQSIAIFQAMSQHERAEQIREYAENHYGITVMSFSCDSSVNSKAVVSG